jgi:sulfur transfer protein SufE
MEKKPAARFELAAQVAEAMQELDEDDERYRRLAELKRQLATEAGDGRT